MSHEQPTPPVDTKLTRRKIIGGIFGGIAVVGSVGVVGVTLWGDHERREQRKLTEKAKNDSEKSVTKLGTQALAIRDTLKKDPQYAQLPESIQTDDLYLYECRITNFPDTDSFQHLTIGKRTISDGKTQTDYVVIQYDPKKDNKILSVGIYTATHNRVDSLQNLEGKTPETYLKAVLTVEGVLRKETAKGESVFSADQLKGRQLTSDHIRDFSQTAQAVISRIN